MASRIHYPLLSRCVTQLVMIDYVPFAYHTYIHTNQPVSEQYSYNWAVFTLVHAHLSVSHNICILLRIT